MDKVDNLKLTIEEVKQTIGILKEQYDVGLDYGPDLMIQIESEQMKLEALEKQICLKPILTEEGEWQCPNCKGHIWHQQQTMHCINCGQLVSWQNV